MSTTCRPDQQCGFVYRPDFCNATAPDSAAEDAFCNVELQSAMMPFLVVTCGSFCIGFVTVLVSMTIQVIGDYWFDSTEQRTAFAEAAAIKMIARWTLRAYQFALCLFLGVHAMYGRCICRSLATVLRLYTQLSAHMTNWNGLDRICEDGSNEMGASRD